MNRRGSNPRGERMRFISLVKWKKKITKESIAQNLKCMKYEAAKEGIKMIDIYWTLGRYDAIAIMEAPDEKAVMKMSVRRGDCMAIETLVAIPAVEARKFVKK
jgi:uncharacterized protein with GYD domain